MRKEELFEAIGNISSETIERNAPHRREGNTTAGRMKWVAAAATLAAIVWTGALTYRQAEMGGEVTYLSEITYLSKRAVDIAGLPQEVLPEQEKVVDISSLLLARRPAGEAAEELATRISQVSFGNDIALYEGVEAVSADILADSLGKELEEEQGWYRVSGHEELQYLICESDGEYSLWKFGSLMSDEYAYKDVLEKVYGITSAKDIRKVTVIAANMDNSDVGKQIQEEIGQCEITDLSDIQQLYGILQDLTCYGSGQWDRINYGGSDAGMTQSVKLGRYLTIELDNGIVIDSLKYTAVSGMFYEYGGVAYNRLSAQDKETVDRILQIEADIAEGVIGDGMEHVSDVLPGSPAETVSTENAGSSQTGDVPIDENTYQEAQGYPKDIEGIQAAISQAMIDKELPFVISSGIYEDPLRIVVTVNTTDEDLINKVKAFDTVGGIIEVVYSDSAISSLESILE